MRLYRDTLQVDEAIVPGGFPSQPDILHWSIGATWNPGGLGDPAEFVLPWHGIVDDVRIYWSNLTPQDVVCLFGEGGFTGAAGSPPP